MACLRTQLNTLEQMGPFLVSLWLFAVFVSARWAGTLGFVYTFFRSLYPVLMGRRVDKLAPLWIWCSTLPQCVPARAGGVRACQAYAGCIAVSIFLALVGAVEYLAVHSLSVCCRSK